MIKQNFYKKIWCCLLLNWVLHLVLKKHDTQFNKFGHSIYQFQQELLSAWELQKALKNGKIKYVCCTTWLLLVPQRLKLLLFVFILSTLATETLIWNSSLGRSRRLHKLYFFSDFGAISACDNYNLLSMIIDVIALSESKNDKVGVYF